MCIFSGPVEDVSNTKIFARHDGNGNQYLVYSMDFAHTDAVAMILPIPVSSHEEDDIRFIDLSEYPTFFDDLFECFRRPNLSKGRSRSEPVASSLSILTVHEVGDYIASFVPTLADFDRLSDCFKLPPSAWDKLPQYADYGFCVFQFNVAKRQEVTSLQRVHPMAFLFPTRHPNMLYFPTIHVHDGEVHSEDVFDHSFYFQSRELTDTPYLTGLPADFCMSIKKTKGIVKGDLKPYRMSIRGQHPNTDTWVQTKK